MSMNALQRHVAARIRMNGPISVAEFMAEALANPRHGYYRHATALGRDGDFITAPEISQMFGELIGAWLAERWVAMGRPDPCLLAELGPGKGTLLADALRASKSVPGFHAAIDLHLIEINEHLRAAQRVALAEHTPRWHEGIASLPEGPLLLVANEFFDALPIRQLVRTARGWCERRVALAADDQGLRFMVDPGPSLLAALLDPALGGAAEGAVAEIAPAAIALAAEIARRVAGDGGAALIVDYGRATPSTGSSLQALRGHRRADPLADAGEADLTAHVDFPSLMAVARQHKAAIAGPVSQGAFLAALGIAARAERLKAGASASQQRDIDSACARLIEPAQMGSLFQALAIYHPGQTIPAGFAAQHAGMADRQGTT